MLIVLSILSLLHCILSVFSVSTVLSVLCSALTATQYYLSFSSSSRQRSWPSLPADGSPLLGKAALVEGPGAPEPPTAPTGAPEDEVVEPGARRGRDRDLKPAESRLSSEGGKLSEHMLSCFFFDLRLDVSDSPFNRPMSSS